MGTAKYTSFEVRVIAAFRRWRFDRQCLAQGQIYRYKVRGWQQREQRQCDARMVRVLDFEQALENLPAPVRVLLLLAHADGYTNEDPVEMSKGKLTRYQIAIVLRDARYALGLILERQGTL